MADAATHTLQEIIEKTIQTTLLKAHPVGSYWLTESDDDPNTLFGGGWERVKGKLLQCSDDTHPAGTDIEAGLPNITGSCSTYSGWQGGIAANVSGAFHAYVARNNECILASAMGWLTGQASRYITDTYFDASRSSSIYGKSDTVQPETHVVNVWKRIS